MLDPAYALGYGPDFEPCGWEAIVSLPPRRLEGLANEPNRPTTSLNPGLPRLAMVPLVRAPNPIPNQ